MAATRRRRKKDPPITSGTTFHVRDQDGANIGRPQPVPGSAILVAQSFAERTPEAQTYYVERQTLFGDPVDLYMVERDEHGVVLTYTLSKED